MPCGASLHIQISLKGVVGLQMLHAWSACATLLAKMVRISHEYELEQYHVPESTYMRA